MSKRNTETLRPNALRAYSIEAAQARGLDIPDTRKATPLDGAVDGLTIPDDDANAVLKTLYMVADLPGPCTAARLRAVQKALNLLASLSREARTILLDAIGRRPRKETAEKLGISQGRISQIIKELKPLCPLAYYILTGEKETEK